MRTISVSTLLSLEDHSDGKLRIEDERVYFAKFDYSKVIELGRDPVLQEQYELRAQNGTIRVRAINGVDFILCSKSWQAGVKGKKEVEQSTTVDMFDNFKKIADSGLRKIRYNIPVEGTEGAWESVGDDVPPYGGALVWEIDVFVPATPPENTRTARISWPVAEWCKIDLEIPQGYPKDNLPAIPDFFSEVFDVQPLDRTPEQQQFVRSIMDSVAVKK